MSLQAFLILVAMLLSGVLNPGFAQGSVSTPFDSHVRVADRVFVFERSLFSVYKGPDVSQWERIYSEEPNDPEFDRKRLGIVSLTPTIDAFLDVMWDPLTEHFEFRNVKDSAVILRLSYSDGFDGALLFNGQGSIYVYGPTRLCTQGRELRKYSITSGKLVEVRQPLVYWEGVNSSLSVDSTLLSTTDLKSEPVAALSKGTKVQVLTKENDWFLVRTPLGLTGWVPAQPQKTPLMGLYNCD